MNRTSEAGPGGWRHPRCAPSRIRGVLSRPCAAAVAVLLAGGAMADEADDAAIDRHRRGALRVLAKPGATVEVEQVRHEFWFGATLPNE